MWIIWNTNIGVSLFIVTVIVTNYQRSINWLTYSASLDIRNIPYWFYLFLSDSLYWFKLLSILNHPDNVWTLYKLWTYRIVPIIYETIQLDGPYVLFNWKETVHVDINYECKPKFTSICSDPGKTLQSSHTYYCHLISYTCIVT